MRGISEELLQGNFWNILSKITLRRLQYNSPEQRKSLTSSHLLLGGCDHVIYFSIVHITRSMEELVTMDAELNSYSTDCFFALCPKEN